MRPTLVLSLACLSAAAFSQFPGAEPVPKAAKPGFDAIPVAEAKRVLTILASDEFEGRGSGYPGFQKAAAFMAGEFKKLGLKPMGDQGYFQSVRFTKMRVNPLETYVRMPSGERIETGPDFAWAGDARTGMRLCPRRTTCAPAARSAP